MRKILLLAYFVVISLGVAQDVVAAEESVAINLQPKFEVGRSTTYEFWTKRTTSVSVQVGAQQRDGTSIAVYKGNVRWSVLEANDDGSARCELKVIWMSVSMTNDEGETRSVDTREGPGENERVHQHLVAVTTAPLIVTVNKDGSIGDIEGIDALNDAAPEGIEVPEEADFHESASDLATIPFAPAAATAGQTWTAAYDWIHRIGQLRHDVTYRYDGVERIANHNIATVTVSGSLALEPNMEKFGDLPDNANVDVQLLSGSYEGTILYDMHRGEAVGRNTKRTTEIQTQLNIGDQAMTQTETEVIQGQTLRVVEE